MIKASKEDTLLEPAHDGTCMKRVLIKPGQAKSMLRVLNMAYLEAGKVFTPHRHTSMEEIFFILKGKGEFIIGREREKVKEGDCILVPANMIHTMINTGKETIEYIVFGVQTKEGGQTVPEHGFRYQK